MGLDVCYDATLLSYINHRHDDWFRFDAQQRLQSAMQNILKLDSLPFNLNVNNSMQTQYTCLQQQCELVLDMNQCYTQFNAFVQHN